MRREISGYQMELFETETDYRTFLKDYPGAVVNVKYSGKLYGIPPEFKIDLVELKKKVYQHIEYVIIY